VIGSKNVTLLAQSEEDLELYAHDRFYFAKLIANAWFSWLKGSNDLESLMQELNGKTLVGEYCGNQKH
jgi:hypothetical protein